MASVDAGTSLATVQAIRDKLFEGLATVQDWSAARGTCIRTTQLDIARGMPVVHVGITPYIPIAEAIEWHRTRRLKTQPPPPPPRKRGRPHHPKAA